MTLRISRQRFVPSLVEKTDRRRRLLSLLVALSAAGAHAGAVTDEEIEDLQHRPSIGLYKAYAEFKMANYVDARRIWQALADAGVAEAWFNLGLLAEDGLGESADFERALAAYQRGAEGGSVKAQYRLALLYLEGQRLKPDRAMAEHWLRRAANAGHEDATRQLFALQSGVHSDDYLALRLLESEGRVAEAATAYRRLSDGGNLRARTRLAWFYEVGRGVGRDLGMAADLFESAAKLGDAEAQFALSVMLRTGAGRRQDLGAADAWLLKAAQAGYPEAMEQLARKRQLD